MPGEPTIETARLDLTTNRTVFRTDDAFVAWSKEEVGQSIGERFEKQVALHPKQTAVRAATDEITYADLNQRANGIARVLLDAADLNGRPVVLLLDDAVPQAAAILGVLKAGGICVVLAPSYPEARMEAIVADTDPALVIADRRHAELAGRIAGATRRVIDVHAIKPGSAEESPLPTVLPDAPAFIIYTSGSSGRPRGVIQTHRNILHNIRRHTHGLRLHSADRIALLSSCSSGQGMATMWCALLNGATLCPRNLGQTSVAGLGEWLNRENITVYVSAATVFRHFIGTLEPAARFPSVRVVRLASEPVTRSDFDLFRRHFSPECLFGNTYSSTETGNLCQFFLAAQSGWTSDAMPIGRPVEDVEVLLLDENGRAVAAGEVGEIIVRSRYLSPGYWNNPGDTAAAFRQSPHGERDYHTGDRGRRRDDGLLEHCGRTDAQVKIRGFRVYPDEVRQRLSEHARVADAFVDVLAPPGEPAHLAAYIIARPGTPPAVADLRQFTRAALPEFMVPSAWIFLEAFPRTPNGKIDRSSLRELKPEAVPSPIAGAARTPVEELLTRAWADVLKLERVGVHDSFFDLGGDSLLVTQLAFRIRDALGIQVSPTALFEQPTVAGFLATLNGPGKEKSSPRAQIGPAPRQAPLKLSFAQERNWRHSQTPRDSLSNLLSNGYVLEGALDTVALQKGLNEMVRRHEPLRTRYAIGRDGLVQRIDLPKTVLLRMIDLHSETDAEARAEEIWWNEARTPIDLEHGPMMRITLIRMGENRHWLLHTVHHIISDAWSRDIFLRELGVLYAAFSHGRPSPLAGPELHYADFAAWQRTLLAPCDDLYRKQFDYWKRQLAGAPAKLDLPFRRARANASADFQLGRLRWSISGALAHSLDGIGRTHGATLFMTRLAAFAAYCRDITGSEEIVMATYMTNRTQAETEHMIGFFSNLVMLRIDLRGNPSFRELLARVRHVTLGATDNSDIPFEELCADLKRHGVRPPKIQIIFEVKHGETSMPFGNLHLRRMERKTATMPWGFQLNVMNRDDGTHGFALFDARIYDPAGVAEMVRALQHRMEGIAAQPDEPLFQARIPRRRWNIFKR